MKSSLMDKINSGFETDPAKDRFHIDVRRIKWVGSVS
jgi:hypothetical protein